MLVPVWTYPVRGLYFFFRHGHRLWPHVVRFVVEVIAAIAVVLFLLLYGTFPDQRSFLARFLPHWLEVPGTIGLILLETAIVIIILFQYRLQRVQRKLFVHTLEICKVKVEPVTEEERAWLQTRLIPQLEGLPAAVSTKKVVRQKDTGKYLGKILTEDEHSVLHFILTLPLNFVPVLGNALFCWLNAFPTAVSLHEFYYTELKGLTSEEFSAVVHAKKAKYQHFGFIASAFDLVPGLDVILVLTNAVGAALWACDMESRRGSIKSKWSLDMFDSGGRFYGTFASSSSSGES